MSARPPERIGLAICRPRLTGWKGGYGRFIIFYCGGSDLSEFSVIELGEKQSILSGACLSNRREIEGPHRLRSAGRSALKAQYQLPFASGEDGRRVEWSGCFDLLGSVVVYIRLSTASCADGGADDCNCPYWSSGHSTEPFSNIPAVRRYVITLHFL